MDVGAWGGGMARDDLRPEGPFALPGGAARGGKGSEEEQQSEGEFGPFGEEQRGGDGEEGHGKVHATEGESVGGGENGRAGKEDDERGEEPKAGLRGFGPEPGGGEDGEDEDRPEEEIFRGASGVDGHVDGKENSPEVGGDGAALEKEVFVGRGLLAETGAGGGDEFCGVEDASAGGGGEGQHGRYVEPARALLAGEIDEQKSKGEGDPFFFRKQRKGEGGGGFDGLFPQPEPEGGETEEGGEAGGAGEHVE